MMLKRLGQAIIVAACVAIGGFSSAFGHSLPDSVLKFWQADERLNLSITLPLEDLVIAEPGLEKLSKSPFEEDLDRQDLDLLDAYFSQHLALQTQIKTIALKLVRAELKRASNDHVGEHILLILEWTAQPGSKGGDANLTLTYDAVMHEVRNHRAVVFWTEADSKYIRLVEFGYRKKDGVTAGISLQLPSEKSRQ